MVNRQESGKAGALEGTFRRKIIPVCKDLTDTKQLKSVSVLLEEEKADVRYLVNNAGIARMGSLGGFFARRNRADDRSEL